jgi:predicted Zn-dependent protease
MPARDILDVEAVVNKIEDDAAFSAPLQRLRRHVTVRDYLRAHPEEARRYADVKGEVARLAAGNRMAYSRAKDRYLHALEQTALRWNGSPGDQ